MKERAISIYEMPVNDMVKIRLLEDLLLDCHEEMAAQDENMHPEVRHELAEGVRLATDYVRQLQNI